MSLWELFNLFRRLPISRLLNYPDFRDSESTREWLAAVLDALDILTRTTDTQIDDEIVRGLEAILESDELWDLIHAMLVRLISEDMVVSDSATEAGRKVNLNPAIIMAIIQVLRILWELFRSRK